MIGLDPLQTVWHWRYSDCGKPKVMDPSLTDR